MFDQSMLIEIYCMQYWSCTAHTLAVNVVCDMVVTLIAVFILAYPSYAMNTLPNSV